MNAHLVETQRLYLRPFAPCDLDALALVNSDPEVMRYTGRGRPLSREETKARLNSYIAHWKQHSFGLWAVVHKKDDALIGFCGLQFADYTSEIEIGFRLTRQYWGNGLATEGARASLSYGFETLALNRVIGLARAANVASQRILEKIGLTYEKDAYYYDTCVRCYAIERKDYEARFGVETRKIFPC